MKRGVGREGESLYQGERERLGQEKGGGKRGRKRKSKKTITPASK